MQRWHETVKWERKLRYFLGAAAALVMSASVADAQVGDWRSRANETVLQQGELHLGLYYEGERDGFMRLGWTRRGDEIHIYDRSMWSSRELYETLEGRIDAVSLAPYEFHTRVHQGSSYFRIDVTFDDNTATGERRRITPSQDDLVRPVDRELPAGTIARATLFFLAAVAPLELGQTITMDWYAPTSDSVEHVVLTAAEQVDIETPAGAFSTLRLEQRGGEPANDIFVDLESGQIVRIDVAGMPLQFLAIPEPGEAE